MWWVTVAFQRHSQQVSGTSVNKNQTYEDIKALKHCCQEESNQITVEARHRVAGGMNTSLC